MMIRRSDVVLLKALSFLKLQELVARVMNDTVRKKEVS